MTTGLDTTSPPDLHDPASLLDYFTELEDPRRDQGRIHRLDDIIFVTVQSGFGMKFGSVNLGKMSESGGFNKPTRVFT